MIPPRLQILTHAMPIDDAVRIELCEGVPVFRASPRVQERIEELLERQTMVELTSDEADELARYEELDEFLSLVNRLVRDEVEAAGRETGVSAA